MCAWVMALLAFFGAAFGVVVSIYIEQFLIKPIFRVEETDDKFYSPLTKCVHHRLRIRNIGLRAATNCTAALTLKDIIKDDIDSTVESVILNSNSFDDQPHSIIEEGLCWSQIGNPSFITINKKSQARLDFYYVPSTQSGTPRIFVYSEEARLRMVLFASRTYEGEILLTSSNTNPRHIVFRLERLDRDVNLQIVRVKPRMWPRLIRYFVPGQ